MALLQLEERQNISFVLTVCKKPLQNVLAEKRNNVKFFKEIVTILILLNGLNGIRPKNVSVECQL